jgi:penicillin amidase
VPDEYETLTTDKIKKPVKIYFNTFGIPSVKASNKHDLFFAIGYLHARDRLWQMDIFRRTARARLSEIFGVETLELDKFFKSLSFDQSIRETEKKLDKKTIQALEAYSAGINAYIEEHKDRLPFEFQALDYFPEKWQPSDCIALNKLIAFDMSVGFINDITIAEISEKTGVPKALSLVSDYPADGPCICDPDFNPPKILKRPKPIQADSVNLPSESKNLISGIFAQLNNLLRNYTAANNGGGSNSVVVKSENSVILANDPHLKLQLPSYWYQLQAISPDFNVTGMSIPGAPFFLIGRNENISWGITIMMLDDCDFFIERIDPDNENYYLTPSGKKKFKYRADTIYIKGAEPLFFYTRLTERSAVISDNYIMKNPKYLINLEKDTTMNFKFYDKFILTFSWTGSRPSKELQALYEVNIAKNWEQFSKALNNWFTPGLNWTYADNKGNMGIKPAGLVPRRNKTNPLIPNPGWMSQYAWNGYILPEKLPFIYNPPKGFVSSSNNKTSGSYPIYISKYFEPPSRSRRIEEIIRIQKVFNIRDVQILQLDNFSYFTKELMFYILPVLEKYKTKMKDTERMALNELKQWDYIFSPAYAAPAIWNAFYKHLLYNSFGRRMSERIFRTYTFISQFPAMKMLQMVKTNDSLWFDDVKTRRKEGRDEVILKSFSQAVKELQKTQQTDDVSKWKLGKQQKLELNHLLSKIDFLKPAIDGGEYIVAGTFTSINKADWHPYDNYRISIGTSARFITDMGDSTVYFSILGGASGDPKSPNYKDQALFFINGGYIKYFLRPELNEDNELGLEIFPE